MRFQCNKTDLQCRRCTECCHFRDKPFMTEEEDYSIRKTIFNSNRTIYLFPLSTYTISISPAEKVFMEQEAKKKKIKINIVPKKLFYDSEKDTVIIFDYSLDHEVCPFLENKNCTVYDNRPRVCRLFPEVSNIDADDVIKFIEANNIICDINFEQALEKVKQKLKV